MWLLLVLGVVILLAVLLYKYYNKDADFWQKKGITFIGFDEVSSTWDRLLFKIPFHFLDQRMYRKIRELKLPFGGSHIFRQNLLYAVDLDLVKHVMVKDFEFFVNRTVQQTPKKDKYFGDMLVIKENQEWKDLRSAMSPTFTTGRIRRMFDIFEQTGSKFVTFIENLAKESNNEIDFQNVCGKYTMEVIASSAFGVDSQIFNEKDPIFSQMGKRVQTNFSGVWGIIKLMFFVIAPKLASRLNISAADTVSTEFFLDILNKTKKHRESSGERRDDFLQLMLDAQSGQLKQDDEHVDDGNDIGAKLSGHKVNKVLMTDNLVAQQCLLFFIAGFDTTETLLTFAAYELALNPEIQEKLATKLDEAIKKNGGKMSYDIITHLEYLDQFTSETLRKHTPGIRTQRVASMDYKIPNSDVMIPKGTNVAVPVYSIHHDEEYYPDPEKFDPERFSYENKAARHPYAYMPFGVGPRNCIAMRFALIEAKTAIAKLAHNFILEPCSRTHIPMKYIRMGAMKPDGGMWLSVRPRNLNAALEE